MRFYPFAFNGKERDEETGYGYTSALGGRYENYYKYDPLHRLTRAGGADQYGFEQAFELSPAGRPLSMSTNGKVKHYAYGEHTPPHAPQRIMVEDGFRHTLHDLRWDPAGNLGQVSTLAHDRGDVQSRFLFWTEDSRLHTVVDDRHHSYYAYDHAGERTLKLTGYTDQIDINADYMHTSAKLFRCTLYPSPYLVFTNHGYTKHYYAGTERLAARVGGGFGRNIAYPDPKISDAATDLFKQCKAQIPNRQLPDPPRQCIRPLVEPMHPELLHENLEHIPRRLVADAYVSENLLLDEFQGFSGNEEEPDVYFYHSDHLGSASWITDGDGIPVQHLQYLPYGDPFVNQRAAGYSERFTFTGKERDEETGYSYFGARYMDHELMTMWLSVDPLSDKYPSISPYAYCVWNPIKLVDPDGREVGDYYTRDGKWVGRDKWNDKKVYICDGKDDKGNFLNAQDLKITHSEFRKKAATVYGESSAYRYSGNTIPDDLKYEMYAIASVLERNGKAYGANSQKAKDFLNKTPEKNNQNNFRVTANAAVINALLGGFDYSYGATQWDGAEQALYPVTEDAGHKDGYELHMNTMGWKISDEHYRKWSDNIGGFKAPQEKKATVGPNKGKIRLRSTAVYNSTIFWKSH